MTTNKQTVKVWDRLVRVGHWTLVIAFFTAYFTEEDFLALHVWAGYVVGLYVLIRILWGFIGTQHARFRDFLYSPAKIVGYLRTLKSGMPQHYVGHNPAGGAMVMALLLSLSITTFTGLKLYAVEKNKGPFALGEQNADQLVSVANPIPVAKAETEKDENVDEDKLEKGDTLEANDQEEFWEEIHELFANLTLLLVLVHVAGVVISSRIDQENLVKTMITGNKEIDDSYQ